MHGTRDTGTPRHAWRSCSTRHDAGTDLSEVAPPAWFTPSLVYLASSNVPTNAGLTEIGGTTPRRVVCVRVCVCVCVFAYA